MRRWIESSGKGATMKWQSEVGVADKVDVSSEVC